MFLKLVRWTMPQALLFLIFLILKFKTTNITKHSKMTNICKIVANHFSAYYEKRQMQLVLLIIILGIKMFLAETATHLGPFY